MVSSECKRVLNLLIAGHWRQSKEIIVNKFGVNDRCGNGIWAAVKSR